MLEALNYVGRALCQMCDHLITTNTLTTKPCGEVFKTVTQKRFFTFTDAKFVTILLMLEKLEEKLRLRFNNYKSKHRSFRKGKQIVPQKRFHSHYVQDDTEVLMIGK